MIYYRLSRLLLRCVLYIVVFIIVSLYAHFPSFYTLIGSFLTALELYIQIYDYLLLIRYLGRITRVTRSPKFSLFDHPIWVLFHVFSCLFLLILCIVWTQFIPLIIHRIVISCVRNLYIILQWLYCFHSWSIYLFRLL